jgi:hypothetical protein
MANTQSTLEFARRVREILLERIALNEFLPMADAKAITKIEAAYEDLIGDWKEES